MIKQAAAADSNGDANAEMPRDGQYHALQVNMIVAVGPGLYFCRPYVDAYFLRSEQHKKYIN
jgi:hypothetical protein